MRKTTLHLNSALPLSAAGEPPPWVHLVPAGVVRTNDGRGPYHVDAAKVIAASQEHLPAVLDEMHAADLAKGTAARAAGWIVELQDRGAGEAGGIWGRVDWTPLGVQLMAEKAYRSLSAAIDVTKNGGVVLAVQRASLTNRPNLRLQPLLQSEEDNMDLMEFLRRLLGLEVDADDATIRTALQAVMSDRTLQSQGLGRIALLAGVATDSKPDAIVTALQASLANAGRAGELQQKVTTLQSQMDDLVKDGKRKAAEAAVDAAITAGRGAVNARRDHFIALHMQDPEGTQATMDAIPSLHDGGFRQQQRGAGADAALTTDDEAVIQLMGIDPAAYKKQRERGIGPVELITAPEA